MMAEPLMKTFDGYYPLIQFLIEVVFKEIFQRNSQGKDIDSEKNQSSELGFFSESMSLP